MPKQSIGGAEGIAAAPLPSCQAGWVSFGPLGKALHTMWKLHMNGILLLYA